MKNDIVSAVNRYKRQLDKESNILIMGMDNPELILTDVFLSESKHQPYYNHATRAIDKAGISHHQLQEELFNRVKEYFTQFDPEVDLELAYKNSYPASVTVEYRGYGLLYFSFYYHTYRDIRRSNQNTYVPQEIEKIQSQILDKEEKIEEYRQFEQNFLRMLHPKNYRSNGMKLAWLITRDAFSILKLGRKKVKSNIEKYINDRNNEIARLKNDIQRSYKGLAEYNKVKVGLDEKFEKWSGKFTELGYEKEEL
ncbi:hypothetical protein JOC34_000621 [Virgibacillus halotolerans]|uniref:hypothetical protein n=1 Tax=Virgibacillus halotolerans TaxID=1071053 RepID=UPI00195FA49C|nr:hypothetical protein [Virgibacillus halotolerans]MBM7598264.1 hypothetical protein [Virgibacillus halotolerans]